MTLLPGYLLFGYGWPAILGWIDPDRNQPGYQLRSLGKVLMATLLVFVVGSVVGGIILLCRYIFGTLGKRLLVLLVRVWFRISGRQQETGGPQSGGASEQATASPSASPDRIADAS